MSVEERLREAAKSNATINIVYHGGSHPGSVRQVIPQRITPTEVSAYCVSSKRLKVFKIAKIEIPPSDSSAPEYQPEAPLGMAPEEALQFVDAMQPVAESLRGIGWHVELHNTGISVHRMLKNGKLKKSAEAGIIIRDVENRPFYVFGPDLAVAHTFSDIDKAVKLFLRQAALFAPNMP